MDLWAGFLLAATPPFISLFCVNVPVQDDDAAYARREVSSGEPTEPATMIVVDRLDDIAPALLHDTTYSSLVMDLLHHEPSTPLDFKYKGKRDDAKVSYEVLLDEDDPTWRRIRYLDMPDVMNKMGELFERMRERQAERKIDDPDNMEQLRKLMAVLASDEKALDKKIAMHKRICRAIEDRFEKRKLHDVMSLEQSLVTGVDSSGSKTSITALEEQASKILGTLAEDKATLQSRIRRNDTYDPDAENLSDLLESV